MLHSRHLSYLMVSSAIMALCIATCFAQSVDVKTTFKPADCPLQASYGDHVTVHYLAKLRTTGEVFDSSYDRGEPLEFEIGDDEMLDGFEQGILGMCKGEKRVLTIPPELGYGDEQVGSIPPGSTLVFTVHLIDIELKQFARPLDAPKSRQKPRDPNSKTQRKREARAKMPLVPLGD